jgi:hypothetical protein
MLEQVVNELLEQVVGQTFARNFLKEIPTQQFKETATPVTPSPLVLPPTLLLEASKMFERLPYFSDA